MPFLSALFFDVVFQLCVAAAPLAPAGPPTVDMATFAKKPTKVLGQPVRSHVQFHSELETWQPYMTRFGSGGYRAFTAWGDGQLLWKRAEFEAPKVRLFARRGSQPERWLGRAQRHQRFVVTLVPREYMAGVLWIEVLSAIPTRQLVPEGAVLHAIRAQELAAREAWAMACGELDRALGAPLPEHAREALLIVREACARRRTDRSPTLPMEAPIVREHVVRVKDARQQ